MHKLINPQRLNSCGCNTGQTVRQRENFKFATVIPPLEFFESFSFKSNESNFSNFFAFSNQSNRNFSNRMEQTLNEFQFDSTPNSRVGTAEDKKC